MTAGTSVLATTSGPGKEKVSSPLRNRRIGGIVRSRGSFSGARASFTRLPRTSGKPSVSGCRRSKREEGQSECEFMRPREASGRDHGRGRQGGHGTEREKSPPTGRRAR